METLSAKNISQTGYRVLFILHLLMKAPHSKSEIIEKINKNPFLNDVTLDTIRLDINTLKSLGFCFKMGNRSNNFRYEIDLSPIKISLSKSELKILNIAKKTAMNFLDFDEILSIYETLEKISKLVEPSEELDELLNFGNYMYLDLKIVKELQKHCKEKNEIEIVYNSPINPNQTMRVVCHYLRCPKKKQKLHLWCTSDKYAGAVYLRVDKIKEIKALVRSGCVSEFEVKKCRYKIAHQTVLPYELEDFEQIVVLNDRFIEIEADYLNEFDFMQRLLGFGSDLIEISEGKIKKKFLSTLKKIQGVYAKN